MKSNKGLMPSQFGEIEEIATSSQKDKEGYKQ
jgi:hypothetical protein